VKGRIGKERRVQGWNEKRRNKRYDENVEKSNNRIKLGK